jgi:hypothetical protein
MIAKNAEKIAEARAKGYKPDEMILVSLIGRINEPNHTVYAVPGRDYDWSWARGLQVCIYVTSGLDWDKVGRPIANLKPSYLALWDAGRSEGAELWLQPAVADIEKPRDQWRWVWEYMPWTPEQNWRFACN